MICECSCSHLYVSMHVSEFGYVLCVCSHMICYLNYHICKIICRTDIRLHDSYYLQATCHLCYMCSWIVVCVVCVFAHV
jgi:hypothetical protein